MKCRYISNIPTLLVVEGKLTSIPAPVQSKPVVAKKLPPKEIKNGSKTETRSLGK